MVTPYPENGNVRDIFKNFHIPLIYNFCDTVDMLVDTGKSFSRFGDGEFKVMTNPNIDHNFQMNSEILRRRLKEILISNDDNVEIGVNRIYFYKDGNEHPKIEEFIYKKNYGKMIIKDGYLSFMKRDHYYDSTFTIPCHHYIMPKDFFESYFEKIKSIWSGKNVILATGDTEILKYKYNIFSEKSKSLRLIELSKKHAFEYQKRIMRAVKQMIPSDSKSDYVVLFGCGIAATVFSYDFGKEGICQSIDIGHLAKEYNNFKNGTVPWSNNESFFSGTKTEEDSRKFRIENDIRNKTCSNSISTVKRNNTWDRSKIAYFNGANLN